MLPSKQTLKKVKTLKGAFLSRIREVNLLLLQEFQKYEKGYSFPELIEINKSPQIAQYYTMINIVTITELSVSNQGIQIKRIQKPLRKKWFKNM